MQPWPNINSTVWYHGTEKEFNVFNTHGLGSHFGTRQQALCAPGGKGRLVEVKLNINNPLPIIDMYSWNAWDMAELLETEFDLALDELKMDILLAKGCPVKEVEFQEQIKAIIQAQGFDGLVYQNTMEGPGYSVVAFESQQIKILRNTSLKMERFNG